jgi:hypothetical protein
MAIDAGRLGRFLAVVTSPSKWKKESISEYIQESLGVARLLEDPSVFIEFTPVILDYINPPDKAQKLPDQLLFLGLSTTIRRTVLVELIQQYVRLVPGGKLRARDIISAHIRSCAVNDIVCKLVSPDFQVFFVASGLLHGIDPKPSISEFALACAALKAIAANPHLLERFADPISSQFSELPKEDIVLAALKAPDLMKFMLSRLVQRILNGDMRAMEILQTIAGSSGGEPARLVCELLHRKNGINCSVGFQEFSLDSWS